MSVRKIPSIIRTKIAKVFEAYSYAGELREVDFLSHFFDLDKMPSKDMRFKTAREEIEKHTCDSNQGDYDTNWVFSDTRFNLNSCSMELYINFLLYIFSPEVRQYGWENCLESVNCELRKCEFEMYEKDIVYDESVIGIRSYPSGPFSMRYSKSKLKLLEPLITADVRQTLYDAIGCCDVYQTVLDHPNAPFRGTSTFEECIKSLFEGKCIDSDSDDMQHIFFSCRPEIIFDIIEYCFDDRYDNLREKINYCLRTNHIPLKLLTREFTWCRNENYGDIIEEIPNDADFLHLRGISLHHTEHLVNATFLLFEVGVNIKIEGGSDVRMAENDTDSLVVAVTFDAAGCKTVAETMEFDVGDPEVFQQAVVMVAVCSGFGGALIPCQKVMMSGC